MENNDEDFWGTVKSVAKDAAFVGASAFGHAFAQGMLEALRTSLVDEESEVKLLPSRNNMVVIGKVAGRR